MKGALPNFNVFAAVLQVEQYGIFFFVKFPVTCVRLLDIYRFDAVGTTRDLHTKRQFH